MLRRPESAYVHPVSVLPLSRGHPRPVVRLPNRHVVVWLHSHRDAHWTARVPRSQREGTAHVRCRTQLSSLSLLALFSLTTLSLGALSLLARTLYSRCFVCSITSILFVLFLQQKVFASTFHFALIKDLPLSFVRSVQPSSLTHSLTPLHSLSSLTHSTHSFFLLSSHRVVTGTRCRCLGFLRLTSSDEASEQTRSSMQMTCQSTSSIAKAAPVPQGHGQSTLCFFHASSLSWCFCSESCSSNSLIRI